ncbi:lymphocyte antigen 86 isoform X2 [Lithobates pipiens]
MKTFAIGLLVCYLRLGEMKEWPRHTICKLNEFEATYQSCDPLQDAGLSLNPCTSNLHENMNVTLGVVLRHDINFLLFRVIASNSGHKLITQETILCERNLQAYSFCGKKKGDFVFYQHRLRVEVPIILKGHFNISLMIFNEDNLIVACADLAIYIR